MFQFTPFFLFLKHSLLLFQNVMLHTALNREYILFDLTSIFLIPRHSLIAETSKFKNNNKRIKSFLQPCRFIHTNLKNGPNFHVFARSIRNDFC